MAKRTEKKEYQLVFYLPMPCNSPAPSPLPPCSQRPPWEKREEAERRREEARRKHLDAHKTRKKGFIESIGSAVHTVASATVDAFSMVSEDFKDSQSPSSVARFQKFFPSFPNEILFGEYELHFVVGPESVMHGRCYVSSCFFSIAAEHDGHYSLVMIPLKQIVSIQKAIVTKPPEHVPAYYPPQFNLVIGGEIPANEASKYPRIDSLVFFTADNLQHMIYGIKHFEEMYAVLDFCWRTSQPLQPSSGDTSQPVYTSPQFLQQARDQQMHSLRAFMDYQQSLQSPPPQHAAPVMPEFVPQGSSEYVPHQMPPEMYNPPSDAQMYPNLQ